MWRLAACKHRMRSSCPAPALRGRHLVCQPPGLGITHAVILAASCSATPMDSSSLGEDKFRPSEPHQNHGPAHTCTKRTRKILLQWAPNKHGPHSARASTHVLLLLHGPAQHSGEAGHFHDFIGPGGRPCCTGMGAVVMRDSHEPAGAQCAPARYTPAHALGQRRKRRHAHRARERTQSRDTHHWPSWTCATAACSSCAIRQRHWRAGWQVRRERWRLRSRVQIHRPMEDSPEAASERGTTL